MRNHSFVAAVVLCQALLFNRCLQWVQCWGVLRYAEVCGILALLLQWYFVRLCYITDACSGCSVGGFCGMRNLSFVAAVVLCQALLFNRCLQWVQCWGVWRYAES